MAAPRTTEEIVTRHPFPGLAVRIMGKVTPDKLLISREASAIVEEERRGLMTLSGRPLPSWGRQMGGVKETRGLRHGDHTLSTEPGRHDADWFCPETWLTP
jgi:hypothetical protein